MSQDFTDNVFDGTHVAQTDMENVEKNFAALKSTFSGTSAPSNTVAGMFWFDTTANFLKVRNEGNSAWQSIWDFGNNEAILTSSHIIDTITTGAILAIKLGDGIITNVKLGAEAVSPDKISTPSAGSNLVSRNDTEVSSVSATAEYKKSFSISRTGVYRTSFRIKAASSGYAGYGRIYKNGAAVGTSRYTGSTSYVTFTQDLSFTIGDRCELYAWRTSGTIDLDQFRLFDNNDFGLASPMEV